MADPVVGITNGIPTSGTGTITTLGQTLLDGANATHGVTTGAAVTTDVAGTFQQYLRGLVKLFTLVTVKAASTGAAAPGDPALVVTLRDVLAAGQATMATSSPVAIASNQSAIPVNLAALSTGGATLSKALSAATTNATSLKGAPGTLYGLTLMNTTATVYYFKLYDKASAPTLALATPVNSAFSTASTGGTLVPATYYYRVSAINANGETIPSTETSQVVGAGTSTNTVTVNWGAVTGATGYKVYGRTTGAELLIATLGVVTTYIDTGSVTPSGAFPIVNTTADTPLQVYPVAASTSGAGEVIPFPVGGAFASGIAWALTGGQADSDTTVAATGVTINFQYK